MHLIDVRTKEEFEEESALGAVNLPVEQIMEGKMPDLPKDTEIGLYCRSGGRAGRAKTLLIENGFTRVTNLGGLEDAKKLFS